MIKALITGISLAYLSGCTTTSMVKKPEVDMVKTVAVVSVYSNSRIDNVDGDSATGSLSGMASMFNMAGNNSKADKNAAAKLIDFGGTRFVEYGKAQLEKDLGRIKGWKVVSSDTFINKPAYKAFYTKMDDKLRAQEGAVRKISGPNYVTVPNMPALPFDEKAINGDLTALAKDLGVDAVAVLRLNLSYEAANAIGNNGTASANIGSHLEVINRNGQTAVLGSLNRVHSADTVAMIAGSIIFNEKTEGVFKQAIARTTEIYSDKINKDL